VTLFAQRINEKKNSGTERRGGIREKSRGGGG